MDALSPKYPSTVDPTLLARVAKGDQEAFERLYEQTSSLLYTLVLRIVGKPADAADLLQEVYLEAWRKASNYDTARGAPLAWLVTLPRSRAIDWVRALAARGKNVTASLDDTPASDLVAQNADALDIRAANERQVLVRASLKSLPPVQQQVIDLAFYEGLTHTEISERLNVPLGTIKTRIRLDRSQGHIQAFGDLRMRQSLIEGEVDHLLLHRRQGLEGSPDQDLALVGRADVQGVRVLGDEVRGGRVVERGSHVLAAGGQRADPINGAASRQRHQPGHRSASSGVVVRCLAPGLQVHLLQEVRRVGRLPHDPQHEGVEQRTGLLVEPLERLLIPFGDPRQERGIDGGWVFRAQRVHAP